MIILSSEVRIVRARSVIPSIATKVIVKLIKGRWSTNEDASELITLVDNRTDIAHIVISIGYSDNNHELFKKYMKVNTSSCHSYLVTATRKGNYSIRFTSPYVS